MAEPVDAGDLKSPGLSPCGFDSLLADNWNFVCKETKDEETETETETQALTGSRLPANKSCIHTGVAQLVEQSTFNRWVEGPSPFSGTMPA